MFLFTVLGTGSGVRRRPPMLRALLAVLTLLRRELVRFYRQPSRVLGAIISPLMFWLLIGSGIGTSFQSSAAPGSGEGYLAYFFPGTLLLILFFTSIFSTISLIEDRREGFLQSVLVAPIPRASLVLGKILGGTTLALMQSLLFLALAPWIGIHLDAFGWARVILILFLNGFLLTGLGFLIAWHFQSIQGFHAVMNLFLMPMWILSGALFPEEGASAWVQMIMKINPLSYGFSAIRISLLSAPVPAQEAMLTHAVIVTLLFSGAVFIFAGLFARQSHARDLK